MRNGAVANVDEQVELMLVKRTALPSAGGRQVMSRGSVVDAAPVASAVTTEVVIELGETNLWVSTERGGTIRRPSLSTPRCPVSSRRRSG